MESSYFESAIDLLERDPQNAGFTKDVHKRICKHLFESALNGECDVWISCAIEDNIPEEDETPHERLMRLSLLTSDMLAYDSAIFSYLEQLYSGRNDNEERLHAAPMTYRPFFFSFLVHPKEIDTIKRLSDNEPFESQWIVGRFSNKRSDDTKQKGIEGIVEFAASPFRFRWKYLEFKENENGKYNLDKDTIDAINNAYDIDMSNVQQLDPNNELLKHELGNVSHVFNMLKPEKIDTFKCGNGNCIRIGTRYTYILHDIGFPRNYCLEDADKDYRPYIQYVPKLRPRLVILSHWHSDHFFGCALADDSLFECRWIVPRITDLVSISAKRVAKFLSIMQKVSILHKDVNRLSFDLGKRGDYLTIWRGAKQFDEKEPNSSADNITGLAVTIKHSDTIASLLGDVPYSYLPMSFMRMLQESRYVIMSHHGRKTLLPKMPEVPLCEHAAVFNSAKIAVISNEAKTRELVQALTNSNPDEEASTIDRDHVRYFARNGFQVMCTQQAEMCITLPLSKLPKSTVKSTEKIAAVFNGEPYDAPPSSVMVEALMRFVGIDWKGKRLTASEFDADCVLLDSAWKLAQHCIKQARITDPNRQKQDTCLLQMATFSYDDYVNLAIALLDEVGLEPCIDAYLKGVPLEDIIA